MVKLAKQQLRTCITLFLDISFPFLHDYDVKMPNFAFMQDEDKQRRFISLSELEFGPLKIQLREGSPTIDKVSG